MDKDIFKKIYDHIDSTLVCDGCGSHGGSYPVLDKCTEILRLKAKSLEYLIISESYYNSALEQICK